VEPNYDFRFKVTRYGVLYLQIKNATGKAAPLFFRTNQKSDKFIDMCWSQSIEKPTLDNCEKSAKLGPLVKIKPFGQPTFLKESIYIGLYCLADMDLNVGCSFGVDIFAKG
jgi:hypothetical protein